MVPSGVLCTIHLFMDVPVLFWNSTRSLNVYHLMVHYHLLTFFFYKADTCPLTVVSAFVWNLALKFCDCVVLWSEVVSQVCQDNVEFCLQVCSQGFPARDLSAELWNAGVSGNLQWPFSNTFLFGARTESYQDPQSNASILSENSWFLCSAYRLPFPGVKCYRTVCQSLYSGCETCISLLGRPGNVSSSRERQSL